MPRARFARLGRRRQDQTPRIVRPPRRGPGRGEAHCAKGTEHGRARRLQATLRRSLPPLLPMAVRRAATILPPTSRPRASTGLAAAALRLATGGGADRARARQRLRRLLARELLIVRFPCGAASGSFARYRCARARARSATRAPRAIARAWSPMCPSRAARAEPLLTSSCRARHKAGEASEPQNGGSATSSACVCRRAAGGRVRQPARADLPAYRPRAGRARHDDAW